MGSAQVCPAVIRTPGAGPATTGDPGWGNICGGFLQVIWAQEGASGNPGKEHHYK